ncbi:MAG: arsenate reductase (glutaredoxin) [Salibacteraceae bacterium]
MSYKIIHNPRCSKSRQALAILESKGLEFEIIDYLKNPISLDELKEVIRKLGIKPYDLIRRNEAVFKEKFKGKELSDNDWIKAMVQHPKLIERPILVTENNAVIGRPPEEVNRIIEN